MKVWVPVIILRASETVNRTDDQDILELNAVSQVSDQDCILKLFEIFQLPYTKAGWESAKRNGWRIAEFEEKK